MKLRLIPIALALLLLCSCGKNEAERSDAPQNNAVASADTEAERRVIEGAEAEPYAEVVTSMLEHFAALDYDGALAYIRESDRAMFDFSDESRRRLYDSLFSHMSCETAAVYSSAGRIFVETDVTSPDMLDVYGDLNLMYIDAMMNGEITSEEESRNFNNEALAGIVAADDLKYKTGRVDVEVVKDADGESRVAFTAELMNAMLGDIQTAQEQVSRAIEEGAEEYTSARDSGAFD